MSFSQTAAENLRCCSTTSTMARKTSQQDSVEMERSWNLQRSKFVNHNSAKKVDVSNVNKLTKHGPKWKSGNQDDKS